MLTVRTHCKNGHEYDVDGFIWTHDARGNLYRKCRVCNTENKRRWRVLNPERAIELNKRSAARRTERRKASHAGTMG
jgi:hypothetical protein